MEIWDYLEILKKRKTRIFFNKDNTHERIKALRHIQASDFTGIIPDLIPFLKDRQPDIRNLCATVISTLFNKIRNKNTLYNKVKDADITFADPDFYKANFAAEDYITLLSIASLNSNGYIREKAVHYLLKTGSARAIPFIIYRLADWVPAVSNAASNAIKPFISEAYLDALLENLCHFEWLKDIGRTNLRAIYEQAADFAIIRHRDYTRSIFSKQNEQIRFSMARALSQSKDISLNDLQLFLKDKHFIIRMHIFKNFDLLTKSEIDVLLQDVSSRIRLETLHRLQGQEDFQHTIRPYLTDRSAAVRYLARYMLKNDITDFAALYNLSLMNEDHIIGSLNGLAETAGIPYVSRVEKYLSHPQINIKKAAFLALSKLDEQAAFRFAYQHLDTGYPGLRNLIVTYLATRTNQEVLERCRAIFKNGSFELKKSMLHLFGKAGKWAVIGDLILGTVDKNEELRNLSVQYVRTWKRKVTTHFILPKPGELERANQLFTFAWEIHEEKKYFKQNPIAELDFYLK